MSGTHDRFVEDLNQHLYRLIEDGCVDLAEQFLILLEEYDLLLPEDADESDYYSTEDDEE